MRASGVARLLAVGLWVAAMSVPAVAGDVRTNHFRVSFRGGSGDPDFDASQPAVAYNSVSDEYLVVWYGDDNLGGLLDEL